MKERKRLYITFAITLAVVLIVGFTGYLNAGNIIGNDTSEYIGADKAKEIALEQAGVDASDAFFEDRDFDIERGKAVYELEFTANGVEYDYDVNAITGEVVKVNREKDDDVRYTQKTVAEEQTTPTPAVKEEVTTKIPVKTERESKQVVQEVSTAKPAEEAKPATEYIGEAKAYEIALGHFGVAAADVTYKRTEFDCDDGLAIYEVEFNVGRVEYDYEINAVTGTVIEAEKDIDD